MTELNNKEEEEILIDNVLNNLKDNGKIIDDIIHKSDNSKNFTKMIQTALDNNQQ